MLHQVFSHSLGGVERDGQAARDAVTAFAEREGVDVWYRTGRTCVVLARYRREPASSAA